MSYEFNERHKRVGLVSNQTPGQYDGSRPHASTVVCDRPECIAKAIAWVAGSTNEPARYYPDASRTLTLFDAPAVAEV